MKVVEKGYREMTESPEINEENVKKNFMPKDMIQRTINICLAIFTLLLEIAVQKIQVILIPEKTPAILRTHLGQLLYSSLGKSPSI